MIPGEESRRAVAALSPELRKLLAGRFAGTIRSRHLIDWATDQLVAGKDSPALRILAGLTGDDSRETQDWFQKALSELGTPFPDEHLCMIYYASDIARDVLAGSIEPLKAFRELWQISLGLNHPQTFRALMRLDAELDTMEYDKTPVLEQQEAVRKTCAHFVLVTDSFTETGVMRLSFDRSLAALRSRGIDAPHSWSAVPRHIPTASGGEGRIPHLNFFRTLVEKENFRDMTIPWTLFLRSQIVGCSFDNADLSETSMTWCDWTNCAFMDANLHGCDLRRSVFRECEFYGAVLDQADLRGAQFIDCRFVQASMKSARLEKGFNVFTGLRRRELRLSKDQARQIRWVFTAGEEPPGG